MKSFIETLVKEGYTYNEANYICVCIFNDIPVEEEADKLYWEWVNEDLKKGVKNGDI